MWRNSKEGDRYKIEKKEYEGPFPIIVAAVFLEVSKIWEVSLVFEQVIRHFGSG
jgi:hypothetical protein